ncbi:MAG: hypothetical protein Q8O16_00840 [Dehalococcoidia bacterium]|nr:hypothetical protein [Dehalococcoidia bacterium]
MKVKLGIILAVVGVIALTVAPALNAMNSGGTAAMANGYARVELEPIFAQTVNTELPYHVFVTPLGESRGLFVAEKTSTYFIIRENGAGTPALSFDYRIVAKRKGYEEVRLQQATSP